MGPWAKSHFWLSAPMPNRLIGFLEIRAVVAQECNGTGCVRRCKGVCNTPPKNPVSLGPRFPSFLPSFLPPLRPAAPPPLRPPRPCAPAPLRPPSAHHHLKIDWARNVPTLRPARPPVRPGGPCALLALFPCWPRGTRFLGDALKVSLPPSDAPRAVAFLINYSPYFQETHDTIR